MSRKNWGFRMDLKIDESELDIPAISPVCAFCARLDVTRIRRCQAFAEIPMEIWEGQNDHRAPYPGDHGLQFTSWDAVQEGQ